jgi:hypothetical protein
LLAARRHALDDQGAIDVVAVGDGRRDDAELHARPDDHDVAGPPFGVEVVNIGGSTGAPSASMS